LPEEGASGSTVRRRTRRSSGAASPPSDESSVSVKDEPKKKKKSTRTSSGLQQKFVDVLAWTIFVLWAIGFLVDMMDLKKNWDLPPGMWGLMTFVCGAAFVAQAIGKKDSGE